MDEEEQAQQWAAEHRTPKDRDFRPGEFEALYKQLPTFEYIFEHGFTALDAVVMDRIVAAINAQYPEFELTLDSFQSRGQPHAKFTVLHQEQVAAAKQQVASEYESRINVLEGQKDQLMQVIRMLGSGGITIHSVVGGVDIRQERSLTIGQPPEISDIAQLPTKAALQDHYNLLCDKLSRLGKALILETDPATKMKLEHQIAEAETFRDKVRQKLEDVERQEDGLPLE